MIDVVQLMIHDALKRAIEHYGVEGTIEAINRVYVHNPQLKFALLEELNKNFIKK